MARRRRTPRWHLALSAFLLLAAVATILIVQWRARPEALVPAYAALPLPDPAPSSHPRAFADTLLSQTEATLSEIGIWPELISRSRQARNGSQSTDDSPDLTFPPDIITVIVPADLPLAVVNLSLTHLVTGNGGQVLAGIEHKARRVELVCGVDSTETTRFQLRHDTRLKRRTGRIAIVIDDFGQRSWNGNLVERFCALPWPLTLAILPNEGRAAEVVAIAHRHGHEALLHLPMEPLAYPEEDPGDGAIFVRQDGATIRALLRQALREVPGVAGVNNHMGSRATADSRVMEEILGELKSLDLFFLDSRTSAESLGYAMASAMGVPAARRDLFIDPVDEVAAVEDKLWALAALAADQGEAIGIGHDREQTLLALQAVLPRLESRGHQLVPVSQLVR
jgi:polysaccharide deacetylase 2 family uncharacterized protein YibQ